MWELDHKEHWVPKNWCFWTVVLEKTLESPLDCKIRPVNPKGNQPWIFIGKTDAEAEAEGPILWPPDMKSQLNGKDSDVGKDWGQEKKGETEDELDGITDSMDMSLSKLCEMAKNREARCIAGPWGLKESDTTFNWSAHSVLCLGSSGRREEEYPGFVP